MTVSAKICGISTLGAAETAIAGGAAYLGFIHFARSPRHLDLNAMAELMQAIRDRGHNLPLVSVVVDPDDQTVETLHHTVRPDLIQLHGKEAPGRVAAIAATAGIGLIKALSVGQASDIEAAAAYEPYVDYLMFDAKPPKDAVLPGGLGLRFDWTLMTGYRGEKPWFLAGGIDAGNVAEAVFRSDARLVDVSSGVESAPGVKDPESISRFLTTVKSL